jgi:5'(3')-deoxyribonucleotidase
MSKRKTIAVDIDDVLAASAEGWVNYSNQKWGTKLQVDDYDEDWAKMWGVDHQERLKRAQHLYRSGLVSTFQKIDEAKHVLEKLSKKYKLVITTSRVQAVQKDTLEWIDRYYKGLFDEVHLAGFFDGGHQDAYKMTKAELCKSIGADYLIDDHPKHCFAVAEAGMITLLFGDYVWNRNIKELPPGVIRVKNWQEVLEFFKNERS